MSDLQADMLDSIAAKIGSLQMQAAVHEKTSIDQKIIMSVLCTTADLLRGEED